MKQSAPRSNGALATAGGLGRSMGALPEQTIVFLGALLTWALFVAVRGPSGWQEMSSSGLADSDAVMRLAQIRDLLSGQGFYDLTQHRMNAPFGLEMHWSRLIDVPIAALIILGNVLLGPEYGEPFAMTVWPMLIFLPALVSICFVSREIGGMGAVLPAMIFAMASPRSLVFSPGQIDHHNVQIMLCLALAACVVVSQRVPKAAAAAGALVALTLSIGLESIAYALVCVAWYPILWILKGQERTPQMALFALGLMGSTLLLAFGLHAPVSGFSAACDVFSFAYAPALIMGAGGLYILSRMSTALIRWPTRFAAAGAVGAVCILSIAAIAPECLKGPYATLTPELREIWFDRVAETQSFQSMFANSLSSALMLYPFLATALACGAWAIWNMARQNPPHLEGLVLVFTMLLIGFLLGLAQVRATNTAMFFALPIFAIFAAIIRGSLNKNGQKIGNSSAMVLAWVLGTNAPWLVMAMQISGAEAEASSQANRLASCGLPREIKTLNQHPPGVVVNGVNLGPWITAYTKHGAVSGQYHRNEKGILDAHRALTSKPSKARKLIEARRGKYVVWCASSGGGERLKEANPDGLVAQIENGAVPDWLLPITDRTKTGLRLYKVVTPAQAAN